MGKDIRSEMTREDENSIIYYLVDMEKIKKLKCLCDALLQDAELTEKLSVSKPILDVAGRDRRAMEDMTDLVCKERPDILERFGGLSSFIGWFRSMRPDLYS